MRATLLLVLLGLGVVAAQEGPIKSRPTEKSATPAAMSRQIAAQFAPLFHQGLGAEPRADYITNFDFDGDWRGDNNWRNLDNRSYPLRAYVYYSVAETATHYFVHYAYFHPRDYKGGLTESTIVDALIAEGLRRAGKDPTGGLADEVALSHENDLEGCLVVAEKRGTDLSKAVVQFVETMAHNHYFRYCAKEARAGVCEAIELDGQRPLIFIEPKGHGAERYTGDRQQLRDSLNGVLRYQFAGRAEDHEAIKDKAIGYDLLALYDTLWPRAQSGANETYGAAFDYQTRALLKFQLDKAPLKVAQKLGALGAAFRGTVGFRNRARPPWAWFDDNERDRPRGEWFFDPASVIARHFELGQEFATAYVYNPYFKIGL